MLKRPSAERDAKEMFLDMPFMYGIVAAVVGVAPSLASVVAVDRRVFCRMKSPL